LFGFSWRSRLLGAPRPLPGATRPEIPGGRLPATPEGQLMRNEVRAHIRELIEAIAKRGLEGRVLNGTWSQCLESREKHAIDLMPDVAFTRRGKKNTKSTLLRGGGFSGRQLNARPGARIAGGARLTGSARLLPMRDPKKEIQRMMEGSGYRVPSWRPRAFRTPLRPMPRARPSGGGQPDFRDHPTAINGLLRSPSSSNRVPLLRDSEGIQRPAPQAVDRNLKAWRRSPNPRIKNPLRWMDRTARRKMSRRLLVSSRCLGTSFFRHRHFSPLPVKARRGAWRSRTLVAREGPDLRESEGDGPDLNCCRALNYMDADGDRKVNPPSCASSVMGKRSHRQEALVHYEDYQDSRRRPRAVQRQGVGIGGPLSARYRGRRAGLRREAVGTVLATRRTGSDRHGGAGPDIRIGPGPRSSCRNAALNTLRTRRPWAPSEFPLRTSQLYDSVFPDRPPRLIVSRRSPGSPRRLSHVLYRGCGSGSDPEEISNRIPDAVGIDLIPHDRVRGRRRDRGST
jgi:hypothetical protein